MFSRFYASFAGGVMQGFQLLDRFDHNSSEESRLPLHPDTHQSRRWKWSWSTMMMIIIAPDFITNPARSPFYNIKRSHLAQIHTSYTFIQFCITFTFSSYTFNSIWYVSLSLSPALVIIGFLTFTFSPCFIFYLLATVVNLWPLYFYSTEQQMSFIQSLARSRKMMIKIFALLCEN